MKRQQKTNNKTQYKKEADAWVKKIINKIFCFHLTPMSIHLHNKDAWGIEILHIMYKEEESKALFKFVYSVISNKIQLHIFWIVVI